MVDRRGVLRSNCPYGRNAAAEASKPRPISFSRPLRPGQGAGAPPPPPQLLSFGGLASRSCLISTELSSKKLQLRKLRRIWKRSPRNFPPPISSRFSHSHLSSLSLFATKDTLKYARHDLHFKLRIRGFGLRGAFPNRQPFTRRRKDILSAHRRHNQFWQQAAIFYQLVPPKRHGPRIQLAYRELY